MCSLLHNDGVWQKLRIQLNVLRIRKKKCMNETSVLARRPAHHPDEKGHVWGPLGALGGLGRPGRCSCRVEAAPRVLTGRRRRMGGLPPCIEGPGRP